MPKRLKKNRKILPRVSLARRVFSVLRRLLSKRISWVVMAVLALLSWFFLSGTYDRMMMRIEQGVIGLAQRSGLALSDIYVEGQAHADMEEISKALNVQLGEPLFFIDIHQIKHNIEAIEWVEYAVVERLYPSTLSIRMVERNPVALWQHEGRVRLIDDRGQVINHAEFKPFSNLIILVGEDAALHAPAFLGMINEGKALKQNISSATRVNGRRWDIELFSGVTIKLPEDNPEKAWNYVLEKQEKERLLEAPIKVIDVRLSDKVFIE